MARFEGATESSIRAVVCAVLYGCPGVTTQGEQGAHRGQYVEVHCKRQVRGEGARGQKHGSESEAWKQIGPIGIIGGKTVESPGAQGFGVHGCGIDHQSKACGQTGSAGEGPGQGRREGSEVPCESPTPDSVPI